MPGFKIGDTGGPANSLVEAMRVHRWQFIFDQIEGLKDVAIYALSTQRPSPQIDQMVMHHKQNQINLPGKHKWNPINVKFYEIQDLPIGDTTTSAIFNYWADDAASAVINFVSNTINPNFRTNCRIQMEDGAGDFAHEYTLYNAWPTKVEPVELNYSSSDLATVQVTLVYDACDEIHG